MFDVDVIDLPEAYISETSTPVASFLGREQSDKLPNLEQDRPLFYLDRGPNEKGIRWLLATDDELQWIVYRYYGKSWRPMSYHAMRDSLFSRYSWLLRGEILKTISDWPETHRKWLASFLGRGQMSQK
jgi:hypothetical protein